MFSQGNWFWRLCLQCSRKHETPLREKVCESMCKSSWYSCEPGDIFAKADFCHTANKRLIRLFKRKGKQLCYKAALETTELTHRFTFLLAEAPYLSLWATELIQSAFDVFRWKRIVSAQPYSVTTKPAKAALEKQTKHIWHLGVQWWRWRGSPWMIKVCVKALSLLLQREI